MGAKQPQSHTEQLKMPFSCTTLSVRHQPCSERSGNARVLAEGMKSSVRLVGGKGGDHGEYQEDCTDNRESSNALA
eukprot:1161401-Pelagomonas_calceolata.AAC.20